MELNLIPTNNILLGVNNHQLIGPKRYGKNELNSPDNDKKLKGACKDFEAIFVNMMLKQMRKTVTENDLFGNTREEKMFREMLDEKLAEEIAQSKTLGVAQMMYNQIKILPK